MILEIGGNDFLRSAAPTAVMEDIRQLIKTSLQAGAQVAMVAVPELSVVGIVVGKPRDSSVYAELCADRIHPNTLGYQHMQQLGWVA